MTDVVSHNLVRKLVKANTGKKVAADAVTYLQHDVTGHIIEIAREAGRIAESFGRSTILKRDMKQAWRRVFYRKHL